MEHLEVEDSRVASGVEEVLSQAAIAGRAPLFLGMVCKAMLDGDSLALPGTSKAGLGEAAQAALQRLIGSDGKSPPVTHACGGANDS